jgi:CRISPR-associated protein Cas2
VARRRYLVAYDIREDRRLRSVASCVEGYGERIQYSVFVCDLSEQEAVLLRGDIEVRIKPSEDSVMIIDLGRAGDSSKFLFLGHHETLPVSSAVIV